MPAKAKPEETAGQIWDSVHDKLAKEWSQDEGSRYRPEPPTMIAKVSNQGGELWLGELPLEENLPALEGTFSLQIQCFDGNPTSRTIEYERSVVRGKKIPGALVLQLNMGKPKQAQEEWPDVIRTVYNSVHQGDNAYIHGMTGAHRAAQAGTMMRARLHGETFDQALKEVSSVRQIKPEAESWAYIQMIRDFGQSRIDAMMSIKLAPPTRRPAGWAEARTLIHATVKEENGTVTPLCAWNQKDESAEARVRAKQQCGELIKETQDLGDWLVEAGKGLCGRCRQRMPASFLVKATAAGLC